MKSADAVKLVKEKRPVVDINKIYIQALGKWSLKFGR
jgi:hypothetical protein